MIQQGGYIVFSFLKRLSVVLRKTFRGTIVGYDQTDSKYRQVFLVAAMNTQSVSFLAASFIFQRGTSPLGREISENSSFIFNMSKPLVRLQMVSVIIKMQVYFVIKFIIFRR